LLGQRQDLGLDILMLVDAQVHESANYDHVYYVEEADALDLVKDD